MSDPILSVRELSKRYAIGRDRTAASLGRSLLALARQSLSRHNPTGPDNHHIWALKDVNFDIFEGERVGLIGRNGAGKSTMLKILSRVAYPTEGEARIRGRVTSLLEVGTGFINNLTGMENIYVNASFHGLSKAEVDGRLEEIIEFSELRKFIHTPIKFYSSGMRARLAFSVAAHLDPDILMLDEVLSVGDMAFARKCLERVEEMTRGNRTIIFVSHSMDAVRRFCTRCIWLEHGKIVMDGAVQEVTAAFTKDTMTLQSYKRWTVEQPPISPASTPCGQKNDPEKTGLPEPPHARLVSASILGTDRRETSSLCVTDEIRLQAVYDILYDNVYALPSFSIFTEKGTLAFFAIHAVATMETYRRMAGRYRSTVIIPENFLATGRHTISVQLSTPSPGKLIRHQEADQALSLYVHEAPIGTLSSLGPYHKVPGTVRPLLNWEDEKLPEEGRYTG